MRRPALLVALAALAGGLHAQEQPVPAVELIVAGPPISAEATGQAFVYEDPRKIDPQREPLSQAYSMLGREDIASQSDNEYALSPCAPDAPMVTGKAEVLARIVDEARNHRVVIINESHTVTQHRDFTRTVIAALRPLGYSVLAAETFRNDAQAGQDPVDVHAGLGYIHQNLGWYSREPVFGAMLREAKALGYRFAAYEQVYNPDRVRPAPDGDWRIDIRDRETEQAQNLAAILQAMAPDEKLVVHVGYAHAREAAVVGEDGWDHAWMAARLKRDHGIDPLTVDQTYCRGSSERVRLAPPSADKPGWFDFYVDHPAVKFRHGRPEWRFSGDQHPVPIPPALRPTDEPWVVEVFPEGEPFDAVPVDRIFVAPGEDARLALKPGRYVARAVRLEPAPD
jgi:hypothetical protein